MENFLNLFLQGNLADSLKRHADLGLAVLVMLIVGLLIIPVPTFIVDLLVCCNISMGLILLLISLYITDALKLSSFPTILLFTTLFRLGLNVATARLILLNADAGQVVRAFGEFVVQGNLVVGVVIFLLLMLINMLVISKGSERVAEVAARFTLDAMPGKQMSIDADLRNGSIDLEQARKKRLDLSRENQLFGSMDGAMKFVKGDVIAGIIIFALNILAGIIIGVTQKDMQIAQAVDTYAILAVGNGLVSIIPSLLMSICAGFIVTRVASPEEGSNLGRDMALQIFAQPKAFAIAGAFIGMLGQIPGLPRIPFTLIGVGVGALAYGLFKSQNIPSSPTTEMVGAATTREDKVEQEKNIALQRAKAQEGQTTKMMPIVTPIALEVASDLVPLVDDSSRFLSELVPMMRDGLFYELGVRFSGIRVRGNEGTLPAGHYVILLGEVPIANGLIDQTQCMANDIPDRLQLLGIEAKATQNPVNGAACSFIPLDKAELAQQAGVMIWDSQSYIILHISAILRKNAAEFVGIQEVQNMLDQLEQAFPALVKELVPKAISIFQLTDVLKRLVEEEISIRDLKSILQVLAEWGPLENDSVRLAEHVRNGLKRYISHKYSGGQNTLVVYLLDPQIEETVRSGIQHTGTGSYLALEPEISQEILSAVRREIGQLPPSAQQPVILTNQEIRRYFKKLVELEFPFVALLSYQELSPEMNIQPLARINLGGG